MADLTAHQEAEAEHWRMTLETMTADDFRPDASSTEHEAFRLMFQAVAITLREGQAMSGVLKLFESVIWSMEERADDDYQGEPFSSLEVAELTAEVEKLRAQVASLMANGRPIPRADNDLPNPIGE